LSGVMVDPCQLTQVIMNLAANARDAMESGGLLTLETSILELAEPDAQLPGISPGRYAVLAISDTGCGMDEKIRAHIFEPFFTTKPEGKGTGLGLAFVYGIIEQSGGTIRVSSELGKGTTFKIYLPCFPGLVAGAQIDQAKCKIPSGCETILVVDDQDFARRLTFDFLCAHGYEVLYARNGREAMQVAKKHREPIHLLLTDILMPKMLGPNLAKRLAAVHPETKVLYMTAYADVMDFADLGLGDRCDVLGKPFMHHELMSKVRHILGSVVAH
jgi:two-component system cell cycle sensor histidine kinase/response regulator CckA